jgi:hypothetical protein
MLTELVVILKSIKSFKMNNLSKYNLLRDRIRTGDLVEWRTNSLLGWLIRLRTGAKVNHSSLVVKFDYDECEQRRYVLEANAGGIELHKLSTRLQNHNGKAWLLKLKPEFNLHRNKILGWAIDKVDTKYDYGSIFKQITANVSVDGNRYFCSEFIQAAWTYAKILPPFETAIQPGDFGKWGLTEKEVEIL